MADPLKPRSAAEYLPSIRDMEEAILQSRKNLPLGQNKPMTDYWLDRYPAVPSKAPIYQDPTEMRFQLIMQALEELRREKDLEQQLKKRGYGRSIEPQAAYGGMAGRSLSDWVKMNPGYYNQQRPGRTYEY